QHDFFIELVEAAFNDLVDYLVGLVGVFRIVPGLRPRDLPLFVESRGRNFFARNIARLSRRDVHRQVFNKLLKFVAARYKVGFAIHFDQHADLATHVNIRADYAFRGNASLFLLGGRQATFAQYLDGAIFIAFGFGDGLLAV